MNLLLKTCLFAVAIITLMVSVVSRDALATEHEETHSSTTSYHAYALLIGSVLLLGIRIY